MRDFSPASHPFASRLIVLRRWLLTTHTYLDYHIGHFTQHHTYWFRHTIDIRVRVAIPS